MDQNNQPLNTTPVTDPNNPVSKKTGPMIGILVIILIIIIILLYVFTSKTEAPIVPQEQSTTTEIQTVTNTSDNILDLESDINTSVQGIDQQNF